MDFQHHFTPHSNNSHRLSMVCVRRCSLHRTIYSQMRHLSKTISWYCNGNQQHLLWFRRTIIYRNRLYYGWTVLSSTRICQHTTASLIANPFLFCRLLRFIHGTTNRQAIIKKSVCGLGLNSWFIDAINSIKKDYAQ